MELTDIARRFIVHWGEMGSSWGVNRSVAQIHALLFFHGQPLHAEEIADTLAIARSNVSNSLKELLNWNLIRVTHVLGDRRDFYETSSDVWELFRTIVRERKEREFDPTVRLLRELAADPALGREPAAAQDRLRSTLEFMHTLGAWSDEMLRLSPATLEKILRLGAQVQRFVRAPEPAPPGPAALSDPHPPLPPVIPPY
ncbi:MAG: GbsR/MarR family transcriptional regulator [Inhella sp.]|jgi:DNA-binding transcriptional regulator GbsR (MarR family)|uniref:GbsR/MarR family transcriptional regulator n=1 Tax=Inhella sp. TaxID=1921806 RepID=UPI0022CA722C|nr:MarR family transcriptional regulator [Inhella sp.]MCZ8234837.1 MarR family transcriptional regulator [Inhella sp.]